MDVLTHGLASYALTKSIFPRASLATIAGAIVAGTLADVDALSAQFGPAAFLHWHRTYLHSFPAAFAIAVVVWVVVTVASRRKQSKDAARTTCIAAIGASLLHVAMDLSQNAPVEPLWPFRAQRYSADWVAHFDLWILLILLVGVLLPKLFGLVTEEIGAKSKGPRGRVGAAIALLLVFVYIGARFVLHGTALALLEQRTYQGQIPHKIAAFAEPGSPLHWRGIVETESALHEVDVNLGPGSAFQANSRNASYKPEPSPALDAAQKTDTIRQFLQAARFPKASAEKTNTGYRVEVRDFAYSSDPRSGLRVMAVVETDANANVTRQELAWDPLAK